MISKQVKELRYKADIFEKNGCSVDGIVKVFKDAADTIEDLSAKLTTANMELESLYESELNESERNMSKSILVIDMPKNCEQCRFSGSDGDVCCLEDKFILEHEYFDKKPDWCPLRGLPKKIAKEDRWFDKEYAIGYNACIDEILK